MKFNKKLALTIATVAMCVLVTVAFTACGSSESSSSSSKKPTYTVATEPTYPPFDTTNDDGEIDGFDMDLITAIGKDQGFKVKFKNEEFDALIPSLKSGDSDIVIAAMKATPERKKQVDFSDTYYTSGSYLMVLKDNNYIKNWSSFKKGGDYVVAAQTGTTCQDACDKLKKEGKIKKEVLLNQFTTCVQQLNTGEVDAVVVDKPVGDQLIAKHPNKYKIVGSGVNKGEFGIAVKKGNTELLDKINAGLKNVKEDGTFDKLLKKWDIESQDS